MRRRLLLTGLLFLLGTIAFAQNVESQLTDAVALYNNRAFAQSRTLLQTLSKAAPDNDAVWYYLGLDEAMLGNADAAISSLRKAVGTTTGTSAAWRTSITPPARMTWSSRWTKASSRNSLTRRMSSTTC